MSEISLEIEHSFAREISDFLLTSGLSPSDNFDEFHNSAKSFASILEKKNKTNFYNLRNHFKKPGIMLIKGMLPYLNLTPTPTSLDDCKKSDFLSEFNLTIISCLVGDIVSYQQQHSGSYFHNLFPIKDEESEQSSMASGVLLEFHTELTFHSTPPDFIILHCLRPDVSKKAKTLFCSIDKILSKLPEKEIRILSENRFSTGIDFSWRENISDSSTNKRCSVIFENNGIKCINFDYDLMSGSDTDSKNALKNVRNLIEENLSSVVLDTGDILVIDNKRVIHARSSYPALYDGNDRWLQRCYVVGNLEACDEERGAHQRMIATKF